MSVRYRESYNTEIKGGAALGTSGEAEMDQFSHHNQSSPCALHSQLKQPVGVMCNWRAMEIDWSQFGFGMNCLQVWLTKENTPK